MWARAGAAIAGAVAVLAVAAAGADRRGRRQSGDRRPGRPSSSAARPTSTASRCSSSPGSARSRRASPAPTAGATRRSTLPNAKQFPSPEDRTVVAPNTDTLYSIAHLDLGKGPIVLSHPDMGKRYFRLRAARPLHERDRLRRDADDRLGGRSLRDLLEREAGEGEAGHAGDQVEVPARLGDRADARRPTRPTSAQAYREDEAVRARAARPRAEAASRRTATAARASRASTRRRPTARRSSPRSTASWRRTRRRSATIRCSRELAPLGVGPGPRSRGRRPRPGRARRALRRGRRRGGRRSRRRPGSTSCSSRSRKGWVAAAGEQHRRLRHRLRLPRPGRGDRARRQHARRGDLPDRPRPTRPAACSNGANDYRITFPAGEAPPAQLLLVADVYDSSGYLSPNPIDRYSLGPSHPPLIERPDGSIVVALQQDEPTERRRQLAADARCRVPAQHAPLRAAQGRPRGDWRPPPTSGRPSRQLRR